MLGAVPCLSADLTTHAVKILHPVGFENGKACALRQAEMLCAGSWLASFLAWSLRCQQQRHKRGQQWRYRRFKCTAPVLRRHYRRFVAARTMGNGAVATTM